MRATIPVLVPLVIWQLPQLVVGFILSLFWREHRQIEAAGFTALRCRTELSFCFSLGFYVFAPQCVNDDILRHEIGHCLQSRYLGPLYLLVVGLPSLVLFVIARIFKKDPHWYHSRFPENWANRLGGVRSENFMR